MPDFLGWLALPLAIFALVQMPMLFTSRGRDLRSLVWTLGAVVLAAVLGADWVVHPAAGMLLGVIASRAFQRQQDWTPVLALLGAALMLSVLGAGWIMYPLAALAGAWLLTQMSSPRTSKHASPRRPEALPEQAGGLPFMGVGAAPEAVPVEAAPRTQATAKTVAAPVGGALAALHRDQRLPGAVRAQLVALDLRTQEALTHLQDAGQASSEGAYLARAIREEYAPTAVRAYLKLPRAQADVTPLQDGKTGAELLHDQLDLLLTAVQDLLDGALRASGQELLTHQRFLEERFRRAAEDLKV